MNPNSPSGGERAPESFESPGESYQGHEADSGRQLERDTLQEARPAAPETNQAVKHPAIPIPTATPPVIPTDDDSTTSVPQTTGDKSQANGDKIEKQWIEKAKTIIGQTKDDPHAQKTEMSKVKAQYIQSRFNKTIKVDSEV